MASRLQRTFTVTERDLDKAILARGADRLTKSCVLAQALIRQGVDLDGCSSQSFTAHGKGAPKHRPWAWQLEGARALVEAFDGRFYDQARAMLPLKVVATREASHG